MNLIEESFQRKEEKKKKRATKIILVAIIVVFLIIVAIVSYLLYIQSTTLKLTLDGQVNNSVKQLLVFESDGTVYVPIKEVASYLGYESFNGEYEDKSESQSKCYVLAKDQTEVANFTLGSDTIYKKDLTQTNSDYEYVHIKNPVKAINGVLYTTAEGIQEGFNVSFTYDQATNRVTIFTLPYLVQFYTPYVLDYGYAEISETFANQKAILDNMLVVMKEGNKDQYGVIDTDGKVLLDSKYDNITYLPNIGDFLVETDRKVGVLSSSGQTKVDIIYDSLTLMDSDAGLYVASRDKKYGVIDTNGVIKIFIENDQVGIDISKFTENNIKSKYLLVNNLIPVKKGDFWGLFDKNGNQVVEFKYDSFGYITSNNKDAYNLLVIPDYNVIVACLEEKYTLLNASGEELFSTIADDIYMTISGGEKHYFISVNDQTIDAEEYLNSIGIRKQSTNGLSSNNSTTNNNTNTSNNTNANTTQNNEEQSSNEQQDNQQDNNQENNNQGNEEGQNNQEQNNEENGENREEQNDNQQNDNQENNQ